MAIKTHRSAPCIFSIIAAAFVVSALPAFTHAAGRAGHHRHKDRWMVLLRPGLSIDEQRRVMGELELSEVDVLQNFALAVVEIPETDVPAHFARVKRHRHVVDVEEDFYTNWIEQEEAPTSLEGAWGAVQETIGKTAAGFVAADRKNKEGVPWGVARVHAPEIWNRDQGQGVHVAVVDSGIDCSHPDLQCDQGSGINILDTASPPMDDNGHGTHVSGTIAARANGSGVIGVAPRVVLMPIKVMDEKGEGAASDILRGAVWAAEHGAQVLNLSLGSPKSCKAETQVIKEILESGITIVASAGNSGPGADTEVYPASYPGVIAVAASDMQDHIAEFSSRGKSISFVAPGVSIVSTWLGGKYAKADGTSMAAPHVTGLAALAIARGARGPAAVRQTLFKAASALCPGGRCASAQEEGVGMIDAREFFGAGPQP